MYKKYLDPYEAKAKLFLIFEDIFSVDYKNNKIENGLNIRFSFAPKNN